jgi:hypothetical protein
LGGVAGRVVAPRVRQYDVIQPSNSLTSSFVFGADDADNSDDTSSTIESSISDVGDVDALTRSIANLDTATTSSKTGVVINSPRYFHSLMSLLYFR